MAKKNRPRVLPETIPEEIDPASLNIQFDHTRCQEKGDFGRQKLSLKQEEYLKKKLEEYSRLSVNEFKLGSASGRLKGLKGFQDEKGLYDDNEPYRLKISKKFRVRGYFNENQNIFFIIEFDPNHEG